MSINIVNGGLLKGDEEAGYQRDVPWDVSPVPMLGTRDPRKQNAGRGRPALHYFEIKLLAGLLGEGSSDVGIFLHHETGIGGTQVEHQAAGYVIDRHGDATVSTDLIGTAGWKSRRIADACGRIERVRCLV